MVCILVPLAIGGIAGIATASEIPGWYQALNKPSFNPPDSAFGPVWTVLYILMGVSAFLIWNLPASRNRNYALGLFLIQLILNFIWSFLFFYFKNLGLAFIEIALLWITILIMIYRFYLQNKIAALLNVPYLLWVTFASVLNLSYFLLN